MQHIFKAPIVQLEAGHLQKTLAFFLFYFHDISLQHYEGVQKTILKTKGLLSGLYTFLDYLQCMLFTFCL